MMTLVVIGLLVWIIYNMHQRLQRDSESYREQLVEDGRKVDNWVEKMRRKATELKERFL